MVLAVQIHCLKHLFHTFYSSSEKYKDDSPKVWIRLPIIVQVRSWISASPSPARHQYDFTLPNPVGVGSNMTHEATRHQMQIFQSSEMWLESQE